MGGLIQGLRERLLEGRLSIGDVVHQFGGELVEPERWSDLAWLEQTYLEEMDRLELLDPCRFSLEYARAPKSPPHIARIVLAAVPDPEHIVLQALSELEERVSIQVLVHAPEELRDHFDDWGRVDAAYWCAHEIAIPRMEDNLVLAGGPVHQCRAAMDAMRAEANEYSPLDTAIGVPDARLVPTLRAVMAEQGLAGHDPAGKPLSEHSLFHLLEAMCSWLGEKSYKATSAMLRHPDVMQVLDSQHGIRSDKLLTQLDAFQNRHLPLSFDEIVERTSQAKDQCPELAEAVVVLRAMQITFADLDLHDALRQTLQSIYEVRMINPAVPKDALFADAANKVLQVLDGLSPEMIQELGLQQQDVFELLVQQCGDQRVYPERGRADVDLEGWMELSWNDAKFMVVTGMNDGFVPDGRVDDVFLPNSMLKKLGLRHDEDREARDAYLMSALIACREDEGRTLFIVGKTSAVGDPMKPSRLLFHCRDEDLLERAKFLFGDAEGETENEPPSMSFKLDVAQAQETAQIEAMHVTSFRDYLACPYRFYLTHVLGMEELTDTKTEMDPGDFGSLMHYAFQEMANGSMRHAEDEHELADFLRDAAERWVFGRYGRHRPLQVDIQLHAAQQRLTAAASRQVALLREGWEIVAAELACEVNLCGMPVQGRIDRVDRHRDTGTIRIVDYKTTDQGGDPLRQHIASPVDDMSDYAAVTVGGKPKRWIDLQLPLYALLLQAHEEFGQVHEVAYFSLPKAISGTGVACWDGYDSAILEAARSCAEGIVNAIQAERFWPPTAHVRYDAFEGMSCGSIADAFDGSTLEKKIGDTIMTVLRHEAIAASAGSGKTFQLAHRYIKLLTRGVSPERISALTFSRKAAGEIFDHLVRYLADAASSDSAAERTSTQIGEQALGTDAYLVHLKNMLKQVHRLRIGTLDSFSISILRAFPMELGIAADLTVVDSEGSDAARVREEVLRQIFDRRYVSRKEQLEFLEAFKQATFGQEEKGLERMLETFLGDYRSYYLTLPEAARWGEMDTIWPQGCPAAAWSLNAQPDPGVLMDRLGEAIDSAPLLANIGAFVEYASGYDETTHWNDSLFKKKGVDTLLEHVTSDAGDAIELSYRKDRVRLEGSNAAALIALMRHVLAVELNKSITQTKGIFRILDQYENLYEELAIRRGTMTFEDAQYLLTAANRATGRTALGNGAEDARLYVDYRLDGTLDHWLLDEFQDTSDLQWAVLQNLADEILQDASGERSFFYVGDVKQAIYGWRGGNAKLFTSILDAYGDAIQQRPLSTSYRSAAPIIDTVNRVFCELPAELPSESCADWKRVWQEHTFEKEHVPSEGYVALIEPPCDGGRRKPEASDRFQAVAALLNEIDPLARGLSVAVLVRSNAAGKALVDVLRGACPEIRIAHEGQGEIIDNPVVALMLSLLQFAAHPGDMLAWRHVELSPLAGVLAARGLVREQLPGVLMEDLHEEGFQGFIRRWSQQLNEVSPLDAYGAKRLQDLLQAAGEFDRTQQYDVNALLRFVRQYKLSEQPANAAVRVMTIHQSKGLGFDVVILPELQDRSMTSSTGAMGLTIARDNEGPQWALKMPRKRVAETDEVLAEQMESERAATSFESLCVLYVAMTRAKRALYMVTSFAGKSSRALYPATFLKQRLCDAPNPTSGKDLELDDQNFVCMYEQGKRTWYANVPHIDVATPTPATELSIGLSPSATTRRRLLTSSPSSMAEGRKGAELLFAQASQHGKALGSEVHSLFECVSWLDAEDVEAIQARWDATSTADEKTRHAAWRQFEATAASDTCRALLSRPSGDVELWLEKKFDMVDGDQWITGTFDRVMIQKKDGAPHEATIVDYKSNEAPDEEALAQLTEHYRPQLELYGRVLSRLCQLPMDRIALKLLFTRSGRVVSL